MFACGFLVEIHFRADRKAPMSEKLRKIVLKHLAAYLFIPVPSKNPLQIKKEMKRRKMIENMMNDKRRSKSMAFSQVSNSQVGARCATPGLGTVNSVSMEEVSQSMRNRRESTSRKVAVEAKRRLSTWRKSIVSTLMADQKKAKVVEEPEEITQVGLLGDLMEIRKTFQRVAEKQAAREYTELIKREWLIAIMVFDRIFFFFYIAYIISSLYMLLPQEEAK